MSNPYDQFVVPENSTNPYDAFSRQPSLDASDIDVVTEANNPNLETPDNFGMLRIPVDVTRGLAHSILSIPGDVGATILEAGQLSQAMAGKDLGVVESFKESAAKRLFDYAKKNEEMPGLFGSLKILYGAEKDAILNTISDGAAPQTLVDMGNAMMTQNEAALKALSLTPSKDTSMSYDIGGGVGSVLKSFGAAYVAKNPSAAGPFMTWTVNSQDYREAIKAGKTPEEAAQIAALSAIGQGKIEGVGMGIFHNLAATSPFIKKILFRAAEQSLEETAQGVVEETVKGVSGVRDTSFNEKMHNVLYQGMLGFIVGAPTATAFSLMEDAAKAEGIKPDDIKSNIDKFIDNKENVIGGVAELMNREALGITNTESNQKTTMDVIKSAAAAPQTEPASDAEAGVKKQASTLATGMQVESARRANEAIAPIMDQEKAAQQKQIANIQAETDDISTNLLREVTSLQEGKTIVDPDVLDMLEGMRVAVLNQKKAASDSKVIASHYHNSANELKKHVKEAQRKAEKQAKAAAEKPADMLGDKKKRVADNHVRPIRKYFQEKGYIKRGSAAYQQLVDANVDASYISSISRVDGKITTLDNTEASQLDAALRDYDMVTTADDTGYVNLQWLKDQMREEVGNPPMTAKQREKAQYQDQMEQLRGQVEARGVEIETATGDDIARAIKAVAGDMDSYLRLSEMDSIVSSLEAKLSDKGVAYSRKGLEDLRARVAANRKAWMAIARETKMREAQLQRLESAKRKVEMSPPAILADKLKTFISGMRKGGVLQKQETKAVQESLIQIINKSGIEANDRAKFISAIKNTQTIEQLEAGLPDIVKRVERLVGAKERRDIYSKIKSILSNTKAKKQSGKPVGKYDAETQSTLDSLREIFRLTAEQAESRLRENFAKNETPSANDALINQALSIAARDDSVLIKDMQAFLEDLSQLISEGKVTRKNSKFATSVRINSMKMQAYEEITKGENIDIIDETSWRRKLQKMGNNLKALQDGWLFGWYDIPDILFGNSTLREALRVGKEASNAKRITRLQMEALEIAAQDVFGFTKRKQWLKKMVEDSKTIDFGEMPDASGKMVRLQMTRAEMRKLWMEWQDHTLHETLFSEHGGNKYTEAMVKQMMTRMEPEDFAFAQAQLDIYQKFYSDVNEVYSKVYGVNLPKNENYSPISRETDSEIETGAFLTEQQYRNSVASGSLKSRVKNLRPLRKQSDVDVYQRHILDMAHFIAFAEKAQQIQGVFGDGGVRKAIEKKRGKVLVDVIDEYVKVLVRGGAERTTRYGMAINTLNRNFALSVLGGKVAMIPKQMTSFIASAADLPIGEWTAGIKDFALHPKKAIALLSQSEMLKARGHSAEQDIAAYGKSIDWEFLKKKQSFDNAMMIPIKIGDRAAIYAGGWPIYRHAINQGKTHEQAIDAFETWFETTQQSGSIDQLSLAQTASPFVRTFTMFRSAPAAYLRAELRAIRHWKSGEITTAQAAKKLAIYHIVIPMLFQFVANGFEWDNEDQAKAAILGPIDGYFILGDLVARLVKGYRGSDPTFSEFAKHIADGVITVLESELDMDEIAEGIADIAKGASIGTGLPASATENIAGGVENLQEGDIAVGTKRIMGWPEGAVDR